MIKLANCTMHDQTPYADQFNSFGFEIVTPPLIKEVAGAEEAQQLAKTVIMDLYDARESENTGITGVLIGGRTDLSIYLAIYAAVFHFKAYVAETKRLRTTDDKFIFNLQGVTPLLLNSFTDGYFGPGVSIDVPNPWLR